MTYIFEAIYPENRIVVNYGDRESLVLTGIRNPLTGTELGYDDLCNTSEEIGSEVVKMFSFDTFSDMMVARDKLTVNEEGFVITYDCGFKFKLKGEEYCKVHRAVSNLTPLHFYREINLDDFKINQEFLEIIPEEFRDDVDRFSGLIEGLHQLEYNRLMSLANEIPEFTLDSAGKKERYNYVEKHCGKDALLVMNILNGKLPLVKKAVHRNVRPKRNIIEGVGISPTLERVIGQLNE